MEARVSEYLSLSMSLIFAFGMAFELPILLMILAHIGVISAAKLAACRRFAIVIIFIAAAILTPPDVISQIALALPMMILYEISILGARWIEKKRNNL
jgi:sec-independent protein translocase protein TatC